MMIRMIRDKPSLKLAGHTQTLKFGFELDSGGVGRVESGKKSVGGNYPPRYSIVKMINLYKDL